MDNEKGFTVLEVLMVAILIGILSILVIPSVSGSILEAKISRTQQDLRTLALDLQNYALKNAYFPETLADLKASEVKDPFTGASYYYGPAIIEGQEMLVLKSLGPDGIEDNEDDIIQIVSTKTGSAEIVVSGLVKFANPDSHPPSTGGTWVWLAENNVISAVTDSDGKFSLPPFKTPGKYTVCVATTLYDEVNAKKFDCNFSSFGKFDVGTLGVGDTDSCKACH